jgi:putative transposase
MAFHVINRGVGRQTLFHKDEDYAAFERVMAEAWQQVPIRILAYTLMPNHWHFVFWPRTDTEVGEFTKWMTHTHTQRWHAHYHSAGSGHLYQGRYKSFPVQENMHLYLVLRYVERNALRANLVQRGEQWPWCSLWRREKQRGIVMLSDWPIHQPADWVEFVNEPHGKEELEALRRSANRGCPFGDEDWVQQVAEDLDLQQTLRPRGRPRKASANAPSTF